ncbi:MAG: hypothetical protein RL301_402 [Actinomycetota bacterium]|jgi:hypothetical protein
MSEQKEKIMAAFGGKRGLIDNGLPSTLFLISFLINKDLKLSLYLSIALSVLLTIWRLLKRETLQHAISGLIGVLICAWFARSSGRAVDYYLPSLWKNLAYFVAYSASAISGWPLIGILLGPILGENFEWRKDPVRRRTYVLASWVWAAMFAIRIVIMYPLWKLDQIEALGFASLILGYPLFLLTVWITWRIIKSK